MIDKKKENGAISTLVLFTVLMFVVILLRVFYAINAKQKSQLEADLRIQDLYGADVERVDYLYDEYFAKASGQLVQAAGITIKGLKMQKTLPISLVATVNHKEVSENIDVSNCKYILNTQSTKLGTDASNYTGSFTSSEEDIPLSISTAETYYLHILTKTSEGNSIETISKPITITSATHSHTDTCYNPVYHVHTGSSSTGGGCYTAPVYHTHTSSCRTGTIVRISTESEPRGGYYDDNGIWYDLYWWRHVDKCNNCGATWTYGQNTDGSWFGTQPPGGTGATHNCGGNYCGKTEETIEKYNLGCGKTEETIEGLDYENPICGRTGEVTYTISYSGRSELKDPIEYRYLRIVITKLRGTPNDSAIQLADWQFLDNSNNVFSYPAGTTITSNLSPTGSSESINKIIDGNSNTKYCSKNWGNSQTGSCTINIDLGAGNYLEYYTYNKYRYYTADDQSSRDPISWSVYGSIDGSTYTLLDTRSNQTITTTRKAVAGPWEFDQ